MIEAKAGQTFVDLGIADKILLLLRLAAVIETSNDPEIIDGLKTVFQLLVIDVASAHGRGVH